MAVVKSAQNLVPRCALSVAHNKHSSSTAFMELHRCISTQLCRITHKNPARNNSNLKQTYAPSLLNDNTTCGILPISNQLQCRFSSSNLKSVSDRIKSIKSIQKITKAMKMIAASKLKGDQRRLEIGIPFCQPALKVGEYLPLDTSEKTDLMLVAISSDKGLCGGVNSAVARQVRQTIAESEAAGNRVMIFGVGDKIRNALQRLYGNRFFRLVNEITKYPLNFAQAALIAERIIQEKPERLKLVYNHFKSVISYETLASDVLTASQADKLAKQELEVYEFEPERSDLWNDFHEFYYACTIYRAMLDSITSEQSARLSAMDTASSNAGDMLSKLTLKYNRARQAKITTELIEIISGANAV